MISRVEALRYKCLRYVSVNLEPFHILIGPNASGKSTFLDVITFLGDIINNGPEQAVFKRSQSFHELSWKKETNEFQLAVEMHVPEKILSQLTQSGKKYPYCRYEIKVGVDSKQMGIRLLTENFFLKTQPPQNGSPPSLFPAEYISHDTIIQGTRRHTPTGWRKVISLTEEGQAYFRSETTEWNFPLRPGPQKSAFAMVPEEERFPVSNWAKGVLSEGLQVLALNSRAMREPCRPDIPLVFRPDGSNLPIVVRHLSQADPKRFRQWMEHVKTVLPHVQEINVTEREIDLFQYLTVKYSNDITVPSWLLSDGTLRLLALTLLAYIPSSNQIFLIEEPENGIHPRALEAIYQSLSSVYDGQVLCATHSPLFLGLSKLSYLLCFASTENGATDIVKGTDHPALQSWKGQVNLDILYAAGVLG